MPFTGDLTASAQLCVVFNQTDSGPFCFLRGGDLLRLEMLNTQPGERQALKTDASHCRAFTLVLRSPHHRPFRRRRWWLGEPCASTCNARRNAMRPAPNQHATTMLIRKLESIA